MSTVARRTFAKYAPRLSTDKKKQEWHLCACGRGWATEAKARSCCKKIDGNIK